MSPHQLTLSDHDRLVRSLSLMMRTEILPMASEIPAEFIAHLSAETVLANRKLLAPTELVSLVVHSFCDEISVGNRSPESTRGSAVGKIRIPGAAFAFRLQ